MESVFGYALARVMLALGAACDSATMHPIPIPANISITFIFFASDIFLILHYSSIDNRTLSEQRKFLTFVRPGAAFTADSRQQTRHSFQAAMRVTNRLRRQQKGNPNAGEGKSQNPPTHGLQAALTRYRKRGLLRLRDQVFHAPGSQAGFVVREGQRDGRQRAAQT